MMNAELSETSYSKMLLKIAAFCKRNYPGYRYATRDQLCQYLEWHRMMGFLSAVFDDKDKVLGVMIARPVNGEPDGDSYSFDFTGDMVWIDLLVAKTSETSRILKQGLRAKYEGNKKTVGFDRAKHWRFGVNYSFASLSKHYGR